MNVMSAKKVSLIVALLLAIPSAGVDRRVR
jgi:hypothetical protein